MDSPAAAAMADTLALHTVHTPLTVQGRDLLNSFGCLVAQAKTPDPAEPLAVLVNAGAATVNRRVDRRIARRR